MKLTKLSMACRNEQFLQYVFLEFQRGGVFLIKIFPKFYTL